DLRDDAGELRVALVGDEEPAQGDLRGAHVLDVDDHVSEGRVEDTLLEPARRTGLDDPEQLALELPIRQRVHGEREAGRDPSDDQGDREHGSEQAERAHPRRFERDDLEIAGQLYHGHMDRPPRELLTVALVLAALAGLGGAAVGAAGVPDRLDRFRELALARQARAQTGGELTADAYREMYALLDEEIVESL